MEDAVVHVGRVKRVQDGLLKQFSHFVNGSADGLM